MEIKEIEQVKEMPCGVNLEEWLEKEGFEIEFYLQNDKENYRLIVDGKDCFPYIPKAISILDYKTKRFETAELHQDVDKFAKYYYIPIAKTFYKLKGWELPKERKFKKITDLKKGEYFKFKNSKTHCKFICIDENDIIFRIIDKNNESCIISFESELNKLVEIIDMNNVKE